VAVSTFENHCLKGKLTFGDPFQESGVEGDRQELEINNLFLIPKAHNLFACNKGGPMCAVGWVRNSSAVFKMCGEREFFIDNLLVRILFIIEMIWWTGLAPWEFELPFPGSLISTFLARCVHAAS